MNNIEYMENNNDAWVKIFKHYLKSEDTVKHILNVINHPSANSIKINKQYTIGKDRVGVIAQIQSPGASFTEQTIIDVRHGGRSYDQLLDLVFDIGVDCKNRIILLEDGEEEYNWSPNSFVIKRFFDFMNEWNKNIYFVQIDRRFVIGLSELTLFKEPLAKSKYNTSKSPKQIPLFNTEYRLFYFTLFSSFALGHFMERIFLSKKIGHFFPNEMDTLEIRFIWNDDGVIFQVSELTSIQTLKIILPTIKDQYDGKKIVIDQRELGPGKVRVVYNNMPVNHFTHMSFKEKIEFTDLISKGYHNFYELMEKNLNKENPLEILEIDTFSDFNEYLPFDGNYTYQIENVWKKDGFFIYVVLDSYEIDYYWEEHDEGADEFDPEDVLRLLHSELMERFPKNSVKWILCDENSYNYLTVVALKIFDIPFSKFSMDKNTATNLLELCHDYKKGLVNFLEDICSGADRSDWRRFYWVDPDQIITLPKNCRKLIKSSLCKD